MTMPFCTHAKGSRRVDGVAAYADRQQQLADSLPASIADDLKSEAENGQKFKSVNTRRTILLTIKKQQKNKMSVSIYGFEDSKLKLLDPEMELLPPLSSPTISSISSSSDLDTESTGSFFHDRSTTLGTLMGVATTFPTITFRVPSHRRDATVTLGSSPPPTTGNVRRRRSNAADLVTERRRRRLRRRRRWWWLCSGEDLKPSSLGEFLEVERRFGEEAVFDGGDLMNMEVDDRIDRRRANGEGTLFADGRVLPPPQPASDVDDGATAVCSICRFSVSLAGICSGGGGG
ncbi:hypothetical protein OSB04_023098 [Centaurea solstitialis]|uniref:Uncharacterized protein n=1 Tax=Centaurea solstitialis TaxID=347529 RepID=A0AA38SWU5_9ASTR|nr:hypothetical protein OSB04_023098 [Centaurea solstitialis]